MNTTNNQTTNAIFNMECDVEMTEQNQQVSPVFASGAGASTHASPEARAEWAVALLMQKADESDRLYTQALAAADDSVEALEHVNGLFVKAQRDQQAVDDGRAMYERKFPHNPKFFSFERRRAEEERAKAQVLNRSLVVPRNLPQLKLINSYEVGKEMSDKSFTSTKQFFNSLEKIFVSHGLQPESEYRRLFPSCLDSAQTFFFEGLLKKLDEKSQDETEWAFVKRHFIEKYDTPAQKFNAWHKLVTMRQKSKSVDEHNKVFGNLMTMTEWEAIPVNLLSIIVYLATLNSEVRRQATDWLITRHAPDFDVDVHQLMQTVASMDIQNDEPIRPTVHKRPHSSENSFVKNKKRLPNSKGKVSGVLCYNGCGQVYLPGHVCPKKKNGGNNNRNNLFSRAAIKTKSVVLKRQDADDKLNDMSDCKLKNKKPRLDQDDQIINQCLIPIYLEGKPLKALLDGGATFSAIDESFCINNKFKIIAADNHERNNLIHLAHSDHTIKRIGYTEPLELRYNGKTLKHSFEIMKLANNQQVSVGADLMPLLGIGYYGLVSTWDPTLQRTKEDHEKDKEVPNESPAGTKEEQENFHNFIKESLLANQRIPPSAFCTIPESVIYLPTPEGASCYRRQYPIPHALKDTVHEAVQKWLADGIIEPVPANIENKWNSPLTLAPKKDIHGNLTGKRPCLDPRHINKYLPDDRYPLPLINDIFIKLSDAKIFSTLDLKSAFHRFKINEDDRHKTTFTSVDGKQYMFRGCPFGLKPISSKFQRVMSIVFDGLPFVTTFVDDIVVYSQNMQDHQSHVKTVIDKLTKVNLLLNPDKCHFAQKSIYLLGFSISEKGRSLDERKLKNIEMWPTPQTGKDLQRFLGVVNYFRDHIPMMSHITDPLNQLRNQENIKKKWTPKHEQSFITIKKLLQKHLTLSYPNFQEQFHVATDASNVGIGAVLFQKIQDKIHYIGFMARSLSKSERNYSTTKRELLAIIFALNKFHQFLWGNPFTLYTDHKALVYIHSQENMNPMMTKWLDTLLDYTFTVVHLPGTSNVLPDYLSRLFPVESRLEGGDDGDALLLNRSVELSGVDRMEPPVEDRQDLLNKAHLFGHFGAEAIVKSIHSNGFHWPKLKEQAVALVSKCHLCQKFNIAKHGFHPLRPISSNLPGDHWAIDLAGPLPTTNQSNNYILIMRDIFSRFVILRAIPDKKSDTIVQQLVNVFCDFGIPKIVQSDNGTEFVNDKMKRFKRAAGFDHRLVTPYHPRANGAAENTVKTTMNVLEKNIQGNINEWDKFLPSVQLSINNKVSKRTNTPPFTIMFGRKLNEFADYSNEDIKKEMTEEEIQERIKQMNEVVFPAIYEKTVEVIKKQKKDFDGKNKSFTFPNGSHVMIKVRQRTKFGPRYTGPYEVIKMNQGGAYVLKDLSGDILTRNYTPSELKLISMDEKIPEQEVYEVQAIVQHRLNKETNTYEYKVRWKGYTPEDDTWEPYRNFQDPRIITDYYKRIGQNEPNHEQTKNNKRKVTK